MKKTMFIIWKKKLFVYNKKFFKNPNFWEEIGWANVYFLNPPSSLVEKHRHFLNSPPPCVYIEKVCPPRISPAHFAWRNPSQRVWATNLGKDPEGIINEDLGYVSQIFLPKTIGNDPMPCGFIYVIAPLMINIIPATERELPFFIPTSWAFHTHL